jgi:hypothetical protein
MEVAFLRNPSRWRRINFPVVLQGYVLAGRRQAEGWGTNLKR